MFNGFFVEWWSHETHEISVSSIKTEQELKERGYDEVPSVEDLVDDLYEVYGDIVFWVKDADGTILYDNSAEAQKDVDHYNSF